MNIKDQGKWNVCDGVVFIHSFGETLQVTFRCPCGCGKAWHFAGRWNALEELQHAFEAEFECDDTNRPPNLGKLLASAVATQCQLPKSDSDVN